MHAVGTPDQPRNLTGFPTSDPAAKPQAKFVGSRSSEVYHYPGCKDAQTIKPGNLVEFTEAPAGKRLHEGCPR